MPRRIPTSWMMVNWPSCLCFERRKQEEGEKSVKFSFTSQGGSARQCETTEIHKNKHKHVYTPSGKSPKSRSPCTLWWSLPVCLGRECKNKGKNKRKMSRDWRGDASVNEEVFFSFYPTVGELFTGWSSDVHLSDCYCKINLDRVLRTPVWGEGLYQLQGVDYLWNK